MSEEFIWKWQGEENLPAFVYEVGQGARSFTYDGWSLIYVTRGSCNVTAERQAMLLSKGSAVWVRGAAVKCTESDEIAYTCLGGDSANIILAEHSIGIAGKESSSALLDIILSLISSARLGILQNKWNNSSAAYDAVTKCCALCERTDALPDIVMDTIKLVKEKYHYIYGVEELAEMVGVSKYHLIRVFSQHMGVSPGQYLKEERLKNALTLLQSGRYAVKEVAAMVGYEGENYFCKVFKARFGVTPGKLKAKRPLEDYIISKEENLFYL